MGELIWYFILFVIVVFIIVYVVLPIIGILLSIGLVILGGIALTGLISGFAVGIKNFFIVLREAHDQLP